MHTKAKIVSLRSLSLPADHAPVPADVRRFLHEAQSRIDDFQRTGRVAAFVPSDFAAAYGILRGIGDSELSRGRLFCEWGSGFGVVTCLAAMLDFTAFGIEIDGRLIDASRRLAADFDVPVEFIHGSFIPREADRLLDNAGPLSWLATETDACGKIREADTSDVDLIFAYPWPDEEGVVIDLFDAYASPGALLLTHHGGDEFRLCRKEAARKRRARTRTKR